MHAQHALLLDALDGYEVHLGAAGGLADGSGIVGVVLAALHIRFDELRRNQLDRVAVSAQYPPPVMR